MRCRVIIFALIFFPFFAFSQVSDYELLRNSGLNEKGYHEKMHDSLSLFEKISYTINKQLAGECVFEPECYRFISVAIKEFGFIPGLIITTDRMTRCSRIGISGIPKFSFDSEDGKFHQGVEVYRLRRKKDE